MNLFLNLTHLCDRFQFIHTFLGAAVPEVRKKKPPRPVGGCGGCISVREAGELWDQAGKAPEFLRRIEG